MDQRLDLLELGPRDHRPHHEVAPGIAHGDPGRRLPGEITGPLYEGERAAEYLRRNTPLPKEGTADDIVGAVLWLVGDAGSYVTGQTVVVDGGWTAR
ncbi:SDR family oxidoreductase [Streptomyces mirabilis]|uniref:SDR family oxidoreductase n=1 Tax=Streptomyces mirabilis TaxID=68239 RepID=UPI0033ADB04E